MGRAISSIRFVSRGVFALVMGISVIVAGKIDRIEEAKRMVTALHLPSDRIYFGKTIASAFLDIDGLDAKRIVKKAGLLAGILSELDPDTVWTIVYLRRGGKTIAEIGIPTAALRRFAQGTLALEDFFSLWVWKEYASMPKGYSGKGEWLIHRGTIVRIADVDHDGEDEKILLVPLKGTSEPRRYYLAVVDARNRFLWSGPITSDPNNPLVFSKGEGGYRIRSIEDVDGDGTVEIIATSDTLHKDRVLHWRGNGFVLEASASSISETRKRAVYIGCYKDSGDPFSTKGRDLHGYGYMSRALTPEACFLTCARKGFHFAGLQYARSCVCDNHYGKYGKADNCNMPCTGDKSKICGGSWANSVYDVSGIKALPITYSGMERNIDRPGGDYKHFDLPDPDPNLCKTVCEKDPECKAWAYRIPKPDASDFATCWLKNIVPDPVPNKRRISGVKTDRFTSGRGEVGRFDRPKLGAYRLDWCYKWGSGCGAEAANAFCRKMGYSRAVSWREDEDIGDRTPTKIIGTGQICSEHFCDGFRFIKCANRKRDYAGSHPGSETHDAGNQGGDHGDFGTGVGKNRGNHSDGRGGFSNGRVGDRFIRFHDDFNRFDPSKWEVFEWKTLRKLDGAGLVRNGVLDLRCDRTDRSPFVVSKPIPLKKGEIFIFRRKVKVHFANRYFQGGIRFYQTDGSAVRMPANRAAWLSAFGKFLFGVNYYNYVYEKPGVRQYVPTQYGFALTGYDWRRKQNYGVLEPVWDRWFEEEIVFNPGAGTVTYRIDGKVVAVRFIPFSGPYLRFVMHSYGWYTGHDVQVDWVDWSVQPEFMRSDQGGIALVDTADMLAGTTSAGNSPCAAGGISSINAKGRVLVDTVNMLNGRSSRGTSRPGSPTSNTAHTSGANNCQMSFRRYIAAYDRLTRGIGDASVSDLRLIRILHAYRKAREAYGRCSGHRPQTPEASPDATKSYQGRCAQEYTRYQDAFAQLSARMATQDDLSFIRLRKRYLRSKHAYEACLGRKSVSSAKKPVGTSHPHAKENTVVYSGSILTNVVIAMRKLPSGEPDPNTVTEHVPDGRKPFYLFVYYQGAKPTDRLGVKWYLRKSGSEEETLLFDENGGRLPKTEGVFSSRIAIEGGSFPPGKYHLIFTVNGKKAIEKYFTVGE